MAKTVKDKFVKVRVSNDLKNRFLSKLVEDGFTQSDFFNACILNYLEVKTYGKRVGKSLKDKSEKGRDKF